MVLLAAVVLRQAGAPLSPASQIAKDFSSALKGRDYDWCERHLTGGFKYQGQKGDVHDREWMLGRIRSWFHPLGYHVDASLTLVSSKRIAGGLLIVSDLKVRSQLFGFGAMPLTETTLRGESRWRSAGGEWNVDRIVEISSRKSVDGKPVVD